MGLNIKNAETESLIRELAGRLDVSLTAAVTDAVRARLAVLEETEADHTAEAQRILEMWSELGRMMAPGTTSENFTDDLYNELGLPK